MEGDSMGLMAFVAKPLPLFIGCFAVSWAIFYVAASGAALGERLMRFQSETLTLLPMSFLVALSAVLLLPTYFGHQMLRIKSLDLKAQANASKSQRDRLTKQANSLGKDAGLLIKTSLLLFSALCVSLAVLVIAPIWDALFPKSGLLNVQWRYALVAGAGLFAIVNLAMALKQFHDVIAHRAKTA
ncbi:MAG: hypothetical protein AAFR74_01945 [Pseudomonadota bacterium]